MKRLISLTAVASVLWLTAYRIDAQGVQLDRVARSSLGAVACVDRHAAGIGAEVLAEGGNAIDAAVAVAFALAVTHPAAGNLGGGGFMIVCHQGKEYALDYREMAPAKAWPEMFLDEHGNIDRKKAGIGRWVVGVPGTVAGLAAAHERFGDLPWRRLVDPALTLARDGFQVNEPLATSLAAYQKLLALYPATARCFLKPDGSPPRAGETFQQPDLANSLRWIAEGGAQAFYHGPIAALIDADMRRHGGLLRAEDFARYEAKWREPIRFPYRGHEVVSMPPPSSGGITMGQILGVLEPMELRQYGPHSATARHVLAEAMRRAFAERAQSLGDPEATAIDVDSLLAPVFLERLRSDLRLDAVTPSEAIGPPLSDGNEGTHTTHFNVVDRFGNAVSNTYTIEQSYGSKVVAPGTGFLLNNELHDFNLKPGLTDRHGRIGTEPNLPRPLRRPLSSMTPTIVLAGGKPVLLAGSPGGRTIINTVSCIVLFSLEFGLSVEEAVAAPRQHHGWFPDELRLESGLGELAATLEEYGHEIKMVKRLGDAHCIAIDPETGIATAVADRRLDGWVGIPAAE